MIGPDQVVEVKDRPAFFTLREKRVRDSSGDGLLEIQGLDRLLED